MFSLERHTIEKDLRINISTQMLNAKLHENRI